jgi:hypothetical protein
MIPLGFIMPTKLKSLHQVERFYRFPWPMVVLAVLFVIVPFLTWYFTWFGRPLSDRDIEKYLSNANRPRHVQHALSQIAQRIVRGDPTVKQWYPQIVAAAHHPMAEIRITAAWVMGQDNSSYEFHQALLELLNDSALMVRRNAALELVRFGDESGRAEIVKMLRPYCVRAPARGRVSTQLVVGQQIGSGVLLARIMQDEHHEIEVRSPLRGQIHRIVVPDGAMVAVGQELVWINSEAGQVWEALRGLYFVGQPEDLPDVERYVRGVPEMPDRIREQAVLTAKAIRTRAERKATD